MKKTERSAYNPIQIIIRRMRYFYKCKMKHDAEEDLFRKQIAYEKGRCADVFGIAALNDENNKVIPRVVISVGNYCTLRCKECSQLVPYVKKQYYEEISLIKESINNLFADIDLCVCVDIVGGEPLLYTDLPSLLDTLIEDDRVGMIEITTNGTVCPSEEILELCEKKGNHKVLFKFSDYGDLSRKRDEIIDKLVKRGIKHEFIPMPEWYKFGNEEIRRGNKSVSEIEYQFFHCMDNVACKTVAKGKLFTCGRASGLDDIGIITQEGADYIVLDQKVDYETLFSFYCKKKSAPICEWCGEYSTDRMKVIPVAEQKE